MTSLKRKRVVNESDSSSTNAIVKSAPQRHEALIARLRDAVSNGDVAAAHSMLLRARGANRLVALR